MLRVEVRLKERAEWVKLLDPRDSTVFIASDPPPPIGEDVRLDLYVGPGGPHVILRGRIISRRVQGDAVLGPGFAVALGPYEREKINYLNAFVRGGLLDLRQSRRLPIRVEVCYTDRRGPQRAYSRDLNEEGIFVITEEPLAEDTALDLEIVLPYQTKPLVLSGVVSHTVLVEDEDVPGMGIRFQLTGAEKDAFLAVIETLHQKFVDGELPDQYLL